MVPERMRAFALIIIFNSHSWLHLSLADDQAECPKSSTCWRDNGIESWDCTAVTSPLQVFFVPNERHASVHALNVSSGQYSRQATLEFTTAEVDAVGLLYIQPQGALYALAAFDQSLCRFDPKDVICFDDQLAVRRPTAGVILGTNYYYSKMDDTGAAPIYTVRNVHDEEPIFDATAAIVVSADLINGGLHDIATVREDNASDAYIVDEQAGASYLISLGSNFQVVVARLDAEQHERPDRYAVIGSPQVDWSGQSEVATTTTFGAAFSYSDEAQGVHLFFASNDGFGLFELNLPVIVPSECWNVGDNISQHVGCATGAASLVWRAPSDPVGEPNDGFNCPSFDALGENDGNTSNYTTAYQPSLAPSTPASTGSRMSNNTSYMPTSSGAVLTPTPTTLPSVHFPTTAPTTPRSNIPPTILRDNVPSPLPTPLPSAAPSFPFAANTSTPVPMPLQSSPPTAITEVYLPTPAPNRMISSTPSFPVDDRPTSTPTALPSRTPDSTMAHNVPSFIPTSVSSPAPTWTAVPSSAPTLTTIEKPTTAKLEVSYAPSTVKAQTAMPISSDEPCLTGSCCQEFTCWAADVDLDSTSCHRYTQPLRIRYVEDGYAISMLRTESESGEYDDLVDLEFQVDSVDAVGLFYTPMEFYTQIGAVDGRLCRFDNKKTECFAGGTLAVPFPNAGTVLRNSYFYSQGIGGGSDASIYVVNDVHTERPSFVSSANFAVSSSLLSGNMSDLVAFSEPSGAEPYVIDGVDAEVYLAGLGSNFELLVARASSEDMVPEHYAIIEPTVYWQVDSPGPSNSAHFGGAFAYGEQLATGTPDLRLFFADDDGLGLFELLTPIVIPEICWNTNFDTGNHRKCTEPDGASATLVWRAPSSAMNAGANDGFNCPLSTFYEDFPEIRTSVPSGPPINQFTLVPTAFPDEACTDDAENFFISKETNTTIDLFAYSLENQTAIPGTRTELLEGDLCLAESCYMMEAEIINIVISDMMGVPTFFNCAQSESRPCRLNFCIASGQLVGAPSASPTYMPTPTDAPTLTLSNQAPSQPPTARPTPAPFLVPSIQPTDSPYPAPSEQPTQSPYPVPSGQPTRASSPMPSLQPIRAPSSVPSSPITPAPSPMPSELPTQVPSPLPSVLSVHAPHLVPSSQNTLPPSPMPTELPTQVPSPLPSGLPSPIPSPMPSIHTSEAPSTTPSLRPTQQPSPMPSTVTTPVPSLMPSLPSAYPFSMPSVGLIQTTSQMPTFSPSIPISEVPTEAEMHANITVPAPTLFGQTTLLPTSQQSQRIAIVQTTLLFDFGSTNATSEWETSVGDAVAAVVPTLIPGTSMVTLTPFNEDTIAGRRLQAGTELLAYVSAAGLFGMDITESGARDIIVSEFYDVLDSDLLGRAILTHATGSLAQLGNETLENSVVVDESKTLVANTTQVVFNPTTGSRRPSTAPTLVSTARTTFLPSHTTTAVPTAGPTILPSVTTTARPTDKPTSLPSHSTTARPTSGPTILPSHATTGRPTARPTLSPFNSTTARPTATPTFEPSHPPTTRPTVVPTPVAPLASEPTVSQVSPTSLPFLAPSSCSTFVPTSSPSRDATKGPSASPSASFVSSIAPSAASGSLPPTVTPATTLRSSPPSTAEATSDLPTASDLDSKDGGDAGGGGGGSSGNSGVDAGLIAVVVVVALVLLFAVVAVTIWMMRRRRSAEENEKPWHQLQSQASSEAGGIELPTENTSGASQAENLHPAFKNQFNAIMSRKSLDLEREITESAFVDESAWPSADDPDPSLDERFEVEDTYRDSEESLAGNFAPKKLDDYIMAGDHESGNDDDHDMSPTVHVVAMDETSDDEEFEIGDVEYKSSYV